MSGGDLTGRSDEVTWQARSFLPEDESEARSWYLHGQHKVRSALQNEMFCAPLACIRFSACHLRPNTEGAPSGEKKAAWRASSHTQAFSQRHNPYNNKTIFGIFCDISPTEDAYCSLGPQSLLRKVEENHGEIKKHDEASSESPFIYEKRTTGRWCSHIRRRVI
jgi:hypothetical protein